MALISKCFLNVSKPRKYFDVLRQTYDIFAGWETSSLKLLFVSLVSKCQTLS